MTVLKDGVLHLTYNMEWKVTVTENDGAPPEYCGEYYAIDCPLCGSNDYTVIQAPYLTAMMCNGCGKYSVIHE